MTAPTGFEFVRDGPTTMLLRADLRRWLLPLLQAWHDDWGGYETRLLETGRGGTRVVRVAAHEVVVRPYRRGGMAAWVLSDTYIGWHPRPFRELETLVTLRQHGAPVVQVYAAAVHWLVPGCYRGWLVTRYLAGSQTLWDWLVGAPPPALRARGLAQVGRAVRHLHESGGWHPDLNLNNILIAPSAASPEVPAVVFIDFDHSYAVKCPPRAPQADLARLERSGRKLDPTGMRVTAADFEIVRAAYAADAPCT